jgi:uncharacterized protein YidB (DUF937 family)
LVPPELLSILRRPAVLAGLGGGVLIIVVLSAWAFKGPGRPSEKELKQKQEAQQLWQDHLLDQSEQLWRQLAQMKGPLRNEAIRHVSEIEERRGDEQRRFDEGEGSLRGKQYNAAQQAFQDVIQMNLWHSADAARELEAAKAGVGADDIRIQEQVHFDKGVQLFQSKDFENARKEFRAVLDLSVPGSLHKTEAEGYLNKIRQSANDQKLFETALADVKGENWTEARNQLQEIANRKGPQSGEARKQLVAVEKALQFANSIGESIHGGAFRTAKSQLDSAPQWPKTHEKLSREMRLAEQQQFDNIRSSAQPIEGRNETSAIRHAQDELHGFEARAEDSGLLESARELDKHLADAYTKALEKNNGDKAAFDTAVAHFEQAKQKRDTEQLGHAVNQEFQRIADGTGMYREHAQIYVKSAIPNAIQALTLASGKVSLPPISCSGSPASQSLPSVAGSLSCSQLDSSNPLQWLGAPLVDLPENANQPGRLPYTLRLIVTVDPSGNVRIEKEGDADKDFFKKAKGASKHWKTTVPKSGGKPVTVRFPFSITFHR